ncbi:hypothetical protein GOP47_0010717 [Adiantum capillus-veneris]|uniref:Chitin-binding type-1 domain-containing protein n=1 Tax=Adiantum capillus-veneris TaxID=13818 RepID=A0A9D4ZIZ9_ADICA|nr:hypothetical protein GOP47_0010717 [Adiantum capillus-veneris]
MISRIIALISVLSLAAFRAPGAATSCGAKHPCGDGSCCSQYGFCGNTTGFCGSGCLSLCQDQVNSSRSTSANGSNYTVVPTLVTDEVFDEFLYSHNQTDCPARGFYNRSSFLAAASTFPDFGTTGGLDVAKRELAAYFASAAAVTDGMHFLLIRFLCQGNRAIDWETEMFWS